MHIEGKAALVTGGASGLGLATATKLAAEGATVVIVDLPSSQGQQIAKDSAGSVFFSATDVRDEGQVQAAVDLAASLGDLSIVVNCAGVGDAAKTVGKRGAFPLDTFKKVIDINLVGTFNVLRLAAAAMMSGDHPVEDEERGVIINTASVAAFDGQVGQAAYSASKAGIAGMTLPIARDLSEARIRVMTIAPGLFFTPLFETLPQESIDSLAAQVPHPSRLGRASEYADLVAHIVTNPMLNGETIRLDGAIRMAPR